MSEASSVTSTRLDLALAVFGKKGKKGGSASASSTDPPSSTTEQAEQNRLASKRTHAMRTAPQHVREKWDAICNLRGRDRNKNAEKSKFTQMILSDRAVSVKGYEIRYC